MENTNNYIHWYYNEDAKEFFKDLLQDINRQSEGYYCSPEQWENSSYHNDTCGSVCFNYDNDAESYVQLWAFPNDEEAKREDMSRYLVTTYINGKEETDGFYVTDNRQDAIRYALESVSELFLWA